MSRFYVQKNFGDAAAAVTAGVFGTVVLDNEPGYVLFHADRMLEQCSTALAFGVDGEGVRLSEEELERNYVSIDVPDSLDNAIKANLLKAMASRWSAAYDAALNRTYANPMAKQMLLAEKNRAIQGAENAIESLSRIALKAVALHCKNVTLTRSYGTDAPSIQLDVGHTKGVSPLDARTVEQLNEDSRAPIPDQYGCYDVVAYVPMFVPEARSSIKQKFSFLRGAQTEREAVSAEQTEQMLAIMTDSLGRLAMPTISPDMIDWSQSTLTHNESRFDDDDWDDNDDEGDAGAGYSPERHGM